MWQTAPIFIREADPNFLESGWIEANWGYFDLCACE